MRTIGLCVVLTVVTAVFVAPNASSGGTPPTLSFVATVKGTAEVTWQLSGDLYPAMGCRWDAVGTGHETFAFASVRPHLIGLYDQGRGQYRVISDWLHPAPLRVTTTRSGSYTVTILQTDPVYCQTKSAVLTAPSTRCGTLTGEVKSVYGGRPMIFADGQTGTSGISRPYVELAGVGGWGFQYASFPWFKKLDPCPSSMNALDKRHLGTAWLQGTGVGMGGGGVPYEKAGKSRILLPPAFWKKNAFTVTNRFVLSFRALNGSFKQVGKETQTISWKMTFKRQR